MPRLALSLVAPLVALLLGGCTRLIFQPLEHHVLRPAEVGVEAIDVQFDTRDQVRLHGWWLPARGEVKGTVLFLHGNAENISTHLGSVWWLPRHGFNVFLFDYRGYGRSEGHPSLAGLREDLQSALRTVLAMDGVDSERLVVFGQSMGGAIAVTGLADSPYRDQVRALIIEGTPTSFRSLAREKLGEFWLTWPLQWLLALTIDDEERPLDRIADISPIPLLIVHGDRDRIIPLHHGRQLYESAAEPKALWIVEGAPHIGAFVQDENRERLVRRLEALLTTGNPAGLSTGND